MVQIHVHSPELYNLHFIVSWHDNIPSAVLPRATRFMARHNFQVVSHYVWDTEQIINHNNMLICHFFIWILHNGLLHFTYFL